MELELQVQCDALKQALKSKHDALINFVLNRSKRDRYEIRKAYKGFYGKELIDDVNSALSGNFRRVIVDLFRTPEERDAIYLYKAMKGAGTDEETLSKLFVVDQMLNFKK
jgi:hypothetical protein